LTPQEKAEYDKKRRATLKQYVFMLDKTRSAELDAKLKEAGLGKTEWFRRCVDEYLGRK
jgi:hypothetical protein